MSKHTLGYVLGVLVLAAPVATQAAAFKADSSPSIPAGAYVQQDIYVAGDTVTVAGTLAGDLAAAGGTVVVSGPVGADIAVVGGNVTLLAPVGDDARIAGGTVTVQGGVGGDLLVAGGQLTIGGPGIQEDLIVAGGAVHVDAPVGGDLRVGGNTVYINAPVAGKVVVRSSSLVFGPDAVVHGSVSYVGDTELVKEPGAVVDGKVVFEQRVQKDIPKAALAAIFSLVMVGKFLALLVSALVVGLFFKRYARMIVHNLEEHPFIELGRGVLAVVVLPVASVFLFATLIGIPLAVLGIIALVALSIFAWIVAAIVTGSFAYKYLLKGELSVTWKSILLGTVLFTAVGLVPVLGWLAQTLAIFASLGAIVSMKWSIVREWR